MVPPARAPRGFPSQPARPLLARRRAGGALAALSTVSTLTALTALATPRATRAQGLDGYGGGPKIYLSKDSSRFLRVTLWSQVWTRWQQLNPGSMLNNNPDTETAKDLGIRRTRILMHGQITPRILVFWIIGANNQTFTTGGLQGGDIGGGTSGIDGKRPQVFVHDSWAEFTINKHAQVGGGILTWSGLSRMTNAATLNFLMVDAPIYNWTTIDASDQFARTFGLYAKGTLFRRMNYRAILTKPFAIVGGQQGATTTTASVSVRVPRPGLPDTTIVAPVAINVGDNAATNALVATPARFNIANWNPNNHTLMPQLYVNWDFFDVESQTLPFAVGSYLGTRRVFNVGAGFQYHPAAMRFVRPRETVTVGGVTRPVSPTEAPNPQPVGAGTLAPGTPAASFNGDWVETPMRHWAVDAFLDLPLRHDGDAITAHTAYYNLDYGPNYVRNIGIMPVAVANPATTVAGPTPGTTRFQFEQPSFGGGGTAYPIHGTGQVWYTQAGYLLPKRMTRHFGRIQPTGALSVVSFERLAEGYVMPELGFNWIFAGQNAKIQFQWRNRPMYESPTATSDGNPQSAANGNTFKYPTQVGMRRLRDAQGRKINRQDIIVQFHVHL